MFFKASCTKTRVFNLALLLALGCGFSGASTAQTPSQPEASTGRQAQSDVVATRFMAATANPHATAAAYEILQAGGSAVDATIAAQMMLTLTEPQSSGIGGGALMMHWNGLEVTALDGRETAPMLATETTFQDAQGKPVPFYTAVLSGRSVGVPGTVRLMAESHRRWGKLPWASLFKPAINLARAGFPVSPRLHGLLMQEQHLKKDPQAGAYFYQTNGEPVLVGERLVNLKLADVFELIASQGDSAFYEGAIAKDIVAKVQNNPNQAGSMSELDLANYRVKARTAICSYYREYQWCGFPPPSSGGIALAQMLGMLERFPLKDYPPKDYTSKDTTAQTSKVLKNIPDAKAVYWMSEAGRLAFADRAAYVADTDFVALHGSDWGGLLDANYIQSRGDLIKAQSMGKASAGVPAGIKTAFAPSSGQPEYGTSHISIVDAQGQAVSMTTTIEDAFGSRQMVRGFLLNNELTDFEFANSANDMPIANRVQAGKRPRSSMSPLLVFNRDGTQLHGALGSPGGSLIINYVLKAAVGLIDWNLSPQQVANMPNFGSRNLGPTGATELEKDQFPPETTEQLKRSGQDVREIYQTSGKLIIWRVKVRWMGAADPRREGVVLGD